MNILVLNGSPRENGNTKIIIDKLVGGASGHNVVVVDVSKVKILACTGCKRCLVNGSKCVLVDETNSLIQKLVNADMIVFATPVYWFGVTAQLKLVMDKMYSNMEGLKGKKIGLISVGADALDAPQYELIHQQFKCISEYLDWEIMFYKYAVASQAGDIKENSEFLSEVEAILA